MIIDQFIKANWYTVPLRGTIERGLKGKKTIPQFESGWRKKYAREFNVLSTELAGSITGAVSNIIAIDCDNQATYDLFNQLDPDYEFIFKSKDKPEGGGTIIYKYDEELLGFKLYNKVLKLDFFSDGGFIYLPTEDNFTKEPWLFDDLPEITQAPASVKNLLVSLVKVQSITTESTISTPVISNRLEPMVVEFVKNAVYSPMLFKIITPRLFRDLPEYVRQGHLHPDSVPEGRGSDYLSRVSAILGADISIKRELFYEAIRLVNNLFAEPMEESRLLKTIINPMIEEIKTGEDNLPIWRYDPHWHKMGLIATARNGECVETFFDPRKNLYYLINHSDGAITTFKDKKPCITTLKILLGRPLTEVQYDTTAQLVKTSLDPSKEFGHVEQTGKFNLFRRSVELNIINNPDSYATMYNRPNTVIQYFQTLIPDDYMRAYVLSFLRNKLTTFKYSPVVLYFIGASGAGKDTFVEILSNIIGIPYVAKPDARVFLEQYNGWLVDKYIVQLDEYGNKLTRISDKQEALGKLKAYTGSQEIQLRAMRSDGTNYRHGITFIVTANTNPLPIELQDRRIAYIKSPYVLKEQKWVEEVGGIAAVVEKLKFEIKDFCYYLATEIKNLSDDDYVIAPNTEDKEKLVMQGLQAYEVICHCIVHEKFDELKAMGLDYSIEGFTGGWYKGRLQANKLDELYIKMTEGHGNKAVLHKALKERGYRRTYTTVTQNGISTQIPYYQLSRTIEEN